MKIHRISLPTPFYVGPVNVYLVQEDPLTLIDVGPRSDDTLKALRSGLDRLGHRLSDIKRIVISHAHADHYGLAQLVVEESGAEVLIHAWDAPAVSASSDYAAYRELLAVIGVPREMIEKMEAGYEKFLGFTYPMKKVEPLEDGDEIVFEHESLTVVHTPGHTPGSICLVRSSNRLVFSSDTVLKNITPNPVLSPDPYDETKRFQSLGEYLVSLARIRAALSERERVQSLPRRVGDGRAPGLCRLGKQAPDRAPGRAGALLPALASRDYRDPHASLSGSGTLNRGALWHIIPPL